MNKILGSFWVSLAALSAFGSQSATARPKRVIVPPPPPSGNLCINCDSGSTISSGCCMDGFTNGGTACTSSTNPNWNPEADSVPYCINCAVYGECHVNVSCGGAGCMA